MTFVIKPTYACNAACNYCYAYKENENEKMSLDNVEKMFSVISNNIFLFNNSKGVKFLWHGGEPLLLGKTFYQEVLKLSEKYFTSKNFTCFHQMQSNLTLIDEEYADILISFLHEKKIGTSVDPFDNLRSLKNGKDYLTTWTNALNILRKKGIKVGIVFTVHKNTITKCRDIFSWLKSLPEEISCRFNPVFKTNKTNDGCEFYVSANEYGKFLIEMYDLYIEEQNIRKRRWKKISPFADWFRIVRSNGKEKVCVFKENCQNSFMGIDYKGNVSGCGRFLASSDIRYGNIYSDDINDILSNIKRIEIADRAKILRKNDCNKCPHWHLCGGGCPSIAYSYYEDFNKKDPFCESYFMFFEHWRSKTKERQIRLNK